MNDQESELGLEHHGKGHGLEIIADTTYTISSEPIKDLEAQHSGGRKNGHDSQQHVMSPNYRPEKGTYSIMIEGKGSEEKPKGVFPQFGNRNQ